MTVCVAIACDNGKAIVLAADKMVGVHFIQAELEIKKLLRIHTEWWAMMAGSDVTPVFDILDLARSQLDQNTSHDATDVIRVVEEIYQAKRREQAEALYLRPRGLSLSRFYAQDGDTLVSGRLYHQIDAAITDHELALDLLVAGFDRSGQARLFTLRNPGRSFRHDIPGFHAIGSGSFGAIYMLYYRSVSASIPVRVGAYRAIEAKWFAEEAVGVGEDTDLHIVQAGGEEIVLDEQTKEEILFRIAGQLSPRRLTDRHRKMLDSIAALKSFPKVGPRVKKRESWDV